MTDTAGYSGGSYGGCDVAFSGWFKRKTVRADVGLSEMTGSDAAWLFGAGNGPHIGPPVTEQNSMAVSAVFRCVSLISGIFGRLPLNVYRDDPVLGRVVEPTHRLAPMLQRVPFPGRPLTAFNWRELWGVHFLLWGNHFSVIRYDNAARVVGFEVAMPWHVTVYRLPSQRNAYVIDWPDGRPRETVSQDDMLHIAGPGFDGIRAPSRIQAFARDAIGLSKTLESGVQEAHENGARMTGMVTLPPSVTPDGLKRMKAHFEEQAVGRGNRGKVFFADGDSKFTSMQISPEDLNTLEFRRYQTTDICRFFGMPPHLLGEAAGTSAWGSGIEQLTIGYKVYSLDADLCRVESELNAKLFPRGDRYVMFDRDALVAADALQAAQVAAAKIGSGQLTINEARAAQHRSAVPDGDTVLVNSTFIPLSRALQPAPTPAAPTHDLKAKP